MTAGGDPQRHRYLTNVEHRGVVQTTKTDVAGLYELPFGEAGQLFVKAEQRVSRTSSGRFAVTVDQRARVDDEGASARRPRW